MVVGRTFRSSEQWRTIETCLDEIVSALELRIRKIDACEEAGSGERGHTFKHRKSEERIPTKDRLDEHGLAGEPAPGKSGPRSKAHLFHRHRLFKIHFKEFRHPVEEGPRTLDGASKDG